MLVSELARTWSEVSENPTRVHLSDLVVRPDGLFQQK